MLLFLKNVDYGTTKNYRDITLTSIAAKIYNALLLNHIESERLKIVFGEIDPQHHKF